MEDELPSKTNNNIDANKRTKSNILKGIFLAGVTGCAILSGFATTISATSRNNASKVPPENTEFPPSLKTLQAMDVAARSHQEALNMGARALLWGTFYAFTGVGLFCYAVWYLSGANTMQEFRQKMASVLPSITRGHVNKGRTEFESISDLLRYLESMPVDEKTSGDD